MNKPFIENNETSVVRVHYIHDFSENDFDSIDKTVSQIDLSIEGQAIFQNKIANMSNSTSHKAFHKVPFLSWAKSFLCFSSVSTTSTTTLKHIEGKHLLLLLVLSNTGLIEKYSLFFKHIRQTFCRYLLYKVVKNSFENKKNVRDMLLTERALVKIFGPFFCPGFLEYVKLT